MTAFSDTPAIINIRTLNFRSLIHKYAEPVARRPSAPPNLDPGYYYRSI